jgi:Kef-type K+ transport system membrane component KefB
MVFESFAANVEFQISLLLFIALAGYLLALRIGQSAVIGEILVGIIVGPSVLSLVSYSAFVKELATMGAIFLLFVVGLHTKFREIYTVRSLVIALGGVAVPWLGGYALATLFGYGAVSAVFVGTALTATSIAITAHVLKEMRRLDTDAAKAIIGAAVVDDVLGLLALSVAAEFAGQGVSLPSVASKAVIALLFLLAGLGVGMRIISKQLSRLDAIAMSRKTPQITFIAAVAIAFAYSVAAEAVGLSAIVGAFIAGVSLENVTIRSYREGSEYLEMIFASIFFISLGVLVNVQAAANAGAFLIALTAVAALTKFAGCWLPARALGMPAKDAAIVGVGMIPRGEIAMIAALYGLGAGLIGQEVYSAILLMSLLTTIATPLLLKRLYAR